MTKQGPTDPIAIVAALDPLAPGEERNDPALRARVHRRALEWDPPGKPAIHRPWGRLAMGAVAAVGALTVAVLLLGTGGGTKSPVNPEFAAAAVRVAEANPRYLVGADGWSVSRAYAFEENSGEMRYSDGQHALDLTWYPARLYEDYLQDRANVSEVDHSIEVDGLPTTTVDYGGADYATMLPPQGAVFIEVRGDLGSEETYREVVGSLYRTDIDSWLSAMPPSVVQPGEQAEIVDRLLKGVPLPPDFDLEGLRADLVLDGDALREGVAPAVACGWLDSWAAADERGDERAKATAVDALATAEDWPAFSAASRPRRESIQEYARSVADGHLDRRFGGVIASTSKGSFAFGPAYALLLECDSITRRPVADPATGPRQP